MTDIFISYSRRDKAFVRALYEALNQLNRDAWVDWRDIAPAVEWEKTIYEGIERAKKFVYVISPDSVASKYCDDEVNHAIRHHKPLVPIQILSMSACTLACTNGHRSGSIEMVRTVSCYAAAS